VKKKPGAILLAGVLKGFVEFFTGNSLGLVAILLAFGGALIFEVVLYIYIMVVRKDLYVNIGIIISSGLASASNILIQLEIFINKDIPLLLFLSFISGVLLGGLLGIQVYNVFNRTGILNWKQLNTQNT
jgi:ABC-type thiamin/hydroxymethylpyrimidine transport system permease subunit